MMQEISEQNQEEIEERITTSQQQSDTLHGSETGGETDQADALPQPEGGAMYQIRQKTESGATISSQGQTRITINYYQAWKKPYDGDGEEDSDEQSEPSENVIKNSLRFARQNFAQLDDPLPAINVNQKELPGDDKDLAQKYAALDEYARCHVLAMAILHGATAREIYQQTDTLYRLVLHEKQNMLFDEKEDPPGAKSSLKANTKKGAPDTKTDVKKDTSLVVSAQEQQIFAFPRQSHLQLQECTWTISVRENGAERLFWWDIDSDGQSAFEMRMLIFLAREYNSKGEHWGPFMTRLLRWSQNRATLQNELAWRSARALGTILWYLNLAELRKQAEDWAIKRGSFAGRKITASLLHGAREIEHQRGLPVNQSSVWRMLTEWTQRFHERLDRPGIDLACATASIYGLIGNASSDIDDVLYGLDKLLQIQKEVEAERVKTLVLIITSAYISLAWAGHIRIVLSHLATIAEGLTHYWVPPQKLKLRAIHRLQREMRLGVALDAFFLITAALPKAIQDERQMSSMALYVQPLPRQIKLPETDQYDVLLVAILTEDTLATSLLTLLCAAMLTKKSKSTFELIIHWAEIVRILQKGQGYAPAQIYSTFVAFLVNLGRKLEQWGKDWVQRNYRQPVAFESYCNQLIQWYWNEKKRPGKYSLSALIHDVIRQLQQPAV